MGSRLPGGRGGENGKVSCPAGGGEGRKLRNDVNYRGRMEKAPSLTQQIRKKNIEGWRGHISLGKKFQLNM